MFFKKEKTLYLKETMASNTNNSKKKSQYFLHRFEMFRGCREMYTNWNSLETSYEMLTIMSHMSCIVFFHFLLLGQ